MDRRSFCMFSASVAVSTMAAKAMALEFFPNSSNHKLAILYGTRYGSTRDAALWIGEGLGAIAQVFDARENPDLSGFNHLIVGTGIYGGQAAPALAEYVTRNAPQLSSKVRALFVVCGQGPSGQVEYGAMLKALVKAEPALIQAFSGRLTPDLLEPDVYKSMQEFYKENNRPWADSDNLSRKDCLAFGKKILAVLK